MNISRYMELTNSMGYYSMAGIEMKLNETKNIIWKCRINKQLCHQRNLELLESVSLNSITVVEITGMFLQLDKKRCQNPCKQFAIKQSLSLNGHVSLYRIDQFNIKTDSKNLIWKRGTKNKLRDLRNLECIESASFNSITITKSTSFPRTPANIQDGDLCNNS